MKKITTILLSLTLLLSFSSMSFAQALTPGRVYVEGSSKSYGDGDTLTVEHGKVIHIARLSEGITPPAADDYWLSCWYPDTLTKKGFVLYGKNGEDGGPFKTNASLWGPYIKNTKAAIGSYPMHFFFMGGKEVAEKGFVDGKKYHPLTITIKVVKASQKISPTVKNKVLSFTGLKKKSISVKAITAVKGYKNTITYKKVSGKSIFKINAKTGAVTVKKGAKRGIYTLKVKISAAGSSFYKSASKTVKFKITVK